MVSSDTDSSIKSVIHLGDFAYNIEDEQGKIGDQFFDHISSAFGAEVPYMITYGNHEIFPGNYSFMRNRFRMP